MPDYIQAIERVRAEAYAAQPRQAAAPAPAPAAEAESEEPEPVDENQLTLFEEEAPAAEAEASAEAEAPAEEEAPAETEATAESAGESPAAEAGSAEAPAAEAEEPPEEKKEPAAQDGIEFFKLPREGEQDVPAEENGGTDLTDTPFNIETGEFRRPRRKPKVFALIVYILFAIPLTLAAILVLLIPAVLFLALSVAAIICGVVVVSAAFNGFAVFADIMVLLGGALVLFALGLLFLWTSIWFVGGAIVALVHGVAALCEKWCYKEVQD